MVETFGDTWRYGWRLVVRYAFGRRDGLRQIRECRCAYHLDLPTLVWTRGPEFPLRRLEKGLMCPECRSRRVKVMAEPPEGPVG